MELRKLGLTTANWTYEVSVNTYSACGRILGHIVNVIDALAEKGSDGFPYLFKLITAVAKIFEGFEIRSFPFAKSVIALSSTLKPAVDLVSCILGPVSDFPDFREDVKTARDGLHGFVKENKKYEIRFVQQDGTPLPDVYKERYPSYKKDRVVVNTSKVAASIALIEALANISSYFSAICESVVKLAELKVVELADSNFSKVLNVGEFSYSAFSFISAMGSCAKVIISAVKYSKADKKNKESQEALKAAVISAFASLAKTIIKLAQQFFKARVTLAYEGIIALVILGIDLFILHLKSYTMIYEKIENKLFLVGAHSPTSTATYSSAASSLPSQSSISLEYFSSPNVPRVNLRPSLAMGSASF